MFDRSFQIKQLFHPDELLTPRSSRDQLEVQLGVRRLWIPVWRGRRDSNLCRKRNSCVQSLRRQIRNRCGWGNGGQLSSGFEYIRNQRFSGRASVGATPPAIRSIDCQAEFPLPITTTLQIFETSATALFSTVLSLFC